MSLKDKKIGILIESDFYEPEIWYYQHRFAEEGIDVDFLTRMWGQSFIDFKGHEYHISGNFQEKSLEGMSDEELASYDAIIVPAGMVADRLRYTEDVNKIPPATEFMKRAFDNKDVIKGVICHGMWLLAPLPELVRGRTVVVHNNLHGDAKNMGAVYVDKDVVIDNDLVTARTGGHCHLFARAIIDLMVAKDKAAQECHPLECLPALTSEPVAVAAGGPVQDG
ncbi:putative cysteine protease YraA [Abditibacteriota bacterium]|nr:putative cysteine protease YraA [Abditibacteriota bacterium]